MGRLVGDGKTQFVAQIDQLENGLQLVVTVRSAPDDVQKKVQLGWCAQCDGAAHGADALQRLTSTVKYCILTLEPDPGRQRYAFDIAITARFDQPARLPEAGGLGVDDFGGIERLIGLRDAADPELQRRDRNIPAPEFAHQQIRIGMVPRLALLVSPAHAIAIAGENQFAHAECAAEHQAVVRSLLLPAERSAARAACRAHADLAVQRPVRALVDRGDMCFPVAGGRRTQGFPGTGAEAERQHDHYRDGAGQRGGHGAGAGSGCTGGLTPSRSVVARMIALSGVPASPLPQTSRASSVRPITHRTSPRWAATS